MRINKDLMRALGLGLLSAQTGPSRTPITGWQTFGKGLASGFDLYNKQQSTANAARSKMMKEYADISQRNEASRRFGVPVSEGALKYQKYLQKNLGIPDSQPTAKQPVAQAGVEQAVPQTKPTPTSGTSLSPTLDAWREKDTAVRQHNARVAAAGQFGISMPKKQTPKKPETVKLYDASGMGREFAMQDAEAAIKRGWKTFNEAKIAREEQADTKNVILKSQLSETSATMKEHRASVGVARNMITTLNQMEALAAKADTGPGQQTINTIRGFAGLLGIDVDAEKLAAGQGLQAFSNQLAMFLRNPDSGGGLPGSASNKDLDFLIAATPGLLKVPGANQILFRSMKAVAQRKIDLAKLAAELRAENPNGVLTAKAREKILELADADLFTPKEREQITSAEALGNKSRKEASPNTVHRFNDGSTIQAIN